MSNANNQNVKRVINLHKRQKRGDSFLFLLVKARQSQAWVAIMREPTCLKPRSTSSIKGAIHLPTKTFFCVFMLFSSQWHCKNKSQYQYFEILYVSFTYIVDSLHLLIGCDTVHFTIGTIWEPFTRKSDPHRSKRRRRRRLWLSTTPQSVFLWRGWSPSVTDIWTSVGATSNWKGREVWLFAQEGRKEKGKLTQTEFEGLLIFIILVDMETTMVCVENDQTCHVQRQQGKSFGSVMEKHHLTIPSTPH